MYLSYSGYKVNAGCPKQYWHKYVDKTTPPKPDNCVNALYGSTIGVLFEYFYTEKWWKLPNVASHMLLQVDPTLDKVIADQRGRVVDWNDEKANYNSRSSLIEDLRIGIPKGLQVIKENRFLGPVSIAEMKLDRGFGPHRVAGRADFVIERTTPHNDLIILDGKGSKHREKYVEEAQLKWYGFLYEAATGRLPDKLGFVFWRFSGEKAVQWIDFTRNDLDTLKAEVLGTMDRIEKGVRRLTVLSDQPKASFEHRQEIFPAQPSFSCNLCSYLPVCEEGSSKYGKKKGSNDGPRKSKSSATLPGSGVRELSLDDD